MEQRLVILICVIEQLVSHPIKRRSTEVSYWRQRKYLNLRKLGGFCQLKEVGSRYK
jgi:hypothetical protein